MFIWAWLQNLKFISRSIDRHRRRPDLVGHWGAIPTFKDTDIWAFYCKINVRLFDNCREQVFQTVSWIPHEFSAMWTISFWLMVTSCPFVSEVLVCSAKSPFTSPCGTVTKPVLVKGASLGFWGDCFHQDFLYVRGQKYSDFEELAMKLSVLSFIGL